MTIHDILFLSFSLSLVRLYICQTWSPFIFPKGFEKTSSKKETKYWWILARLIEVMWITTLWFQTSLSTTNKTKEIWCEWSSSSSQIKFFEFVDTINKRERERDWIKSRDVSKIEHVLFIEFNFGFVLFNPTKARSIFSMFVRISFLSSCHLTYIDFFSIVFLLFDFQWDNLLDGIGRNSIIQYLREREKTNDTFAICVF